MHLDPRRAAAFLILVAALSACSRKDEPMAEPGAVLAQGKLRVVASPAPASPPPADKRSVAPMSAPAEVSEATAEAPLRRYLAVRHDLAIVTDADGVEAAWKSAEAACVAAGCDVLASSIARDDERSPATAALDARVPPAALPAFLARLGELGSVGQHATVAEDRTDEVIDVEAKQRNTAEFRDNLRRLMATPNAKLKDLIDVERELVRVQSELDSLATRRKVLGNETDKVRVSIAFSARPAVLQRGMWAPVRESFLRAGHVFADSVAALIGFAVAVLPWSLVLLALVACVRVWRRRRRSLSAAAVAE